MEIKGNWSKLKNLFTPINLEMLFRSILPVDTENYYILLNLEMLLSFLPADSLSFLHTDKL